MNRAELVEAIIKASNVEKKQVDAVLRAFVDVTEKTVKKGENVTIVGFGVFSQSKRKARTAHNPRTGEAIKVAAKKAPTFKAGKQFKDIVNGKAAPAKAEKPAKTAKKAAPAKAAAKPAKASTKAGTPAKATPKKNKK